jgi:hypothetical protein
MSTLPKADTRAHRVISEMRPAMAKADLRKAENVEKPADIGGCLDFARNYVGWNLDQLAAALKRDPRQVRRWIANEENLQLAAVFKVPQLRGPFVIALAKLTPDCEIDTVVRVRIA